MVSEDPFDELDGPRTEQDRPGLVRLGLEQAADQVVDCDVLVFLVRFDVHVVEPPAALWYPERLEPCAVAEPSDPPNSSRNSPDARPEHHGGGDGDRTSR